MRRRSSRYVRRLPHDGEGVPPLRVAGILPAIRGQDARDTRTLRKPAFSLLGTPAVESLAKRQWSASYLALVQATEETLEGHRLSGGHDAMLW